MEALGTALAPFATEALKTWGSYVFVLIVLGVTSWRTRTENDRLRKDLAESQAQRVEENDRLRRDLSDLQAKRVEDAQHLIQLAETGNERMVTRYSGDLQTTEMMAAMASAFKDLRRQVADLAAKATE